MPISTNVAVVVGLADSQPSALGSTTRSGVESIVNYVTATAGVETAWSLAIGSGVAATYMFEVHVTAVSDDSADASAYVIFYSVRWDGATLAQIAAPYVGPNDETTPALSSATMDVSGTSVRLRVGGTADWRYGGIVRYTRTTFT